MAPMNTPTWLPRTFPGFIPASSRASQVSSSASRCCGSIATASREDIPKNSASKQATSSRKPPRRIFVLSVSGSSPPNAVSTSQRSAGTCVIGFRPPRRNGQKAAGLDAPGKRQDMPTMAISLPGAEYSLLTLIPIPDGPGTSRNVTDARRCRQPLNVGWPLRSEQVGLPPRLAEHVLRQERVDGLVPDGHVTGLQDPVVLVGEVQEPGAWHLALCIRPEPQRLADRDAVVLVPVNHQHRRADLAEAPVGRVGGVALRLGNRVTENPAPVRRQVGGPEHLVKDPQPGVADDRGEPVGVASDPVGHVAAERTAHHRGARLVDVGPGHRRIGDRHYVGIWPLSPRPSGSPSPPRTGVPSSAGTSISSSRPGNSSGEPGLASGVGSLPGAVTSIRTGVGGWSTAERSA